VDWPVAIECGLQDALAGAQSGQLALEGLHLRRRDDGLDRGELAPYRLVLDRRAEAAERRQHRADRPDRDFEADLERRVADHGFGLVKGPHEDHRREVAEVARRAGRAPLRRRTVSDTVTTVDHSDDAVGDWPSESPFAQGPAHVAAHMVGEGVGVTVNVQRHCLGLDPHPELDARIGRPWLDTQADGGLERVGFAVEDLNGLAEADRTLDADARSFAECDADAELSRQGRLDDLLLNLAIERNGDL